MLHHQFWLVLSSVVTLNMSINLRDFISFYIFFIFGIFKVAKTYTWFLNTQKVRLDIVVKRTGFYPTIDHEERLVWQKVPDYHYFRFAPSFIVFFSKIYLGNIWLYISTSPTIKLLVAVWSISWKNSSLLNSNPDLLLNVQDKLYHTSLLFVWKKF